MKLSVIIPVLNEAEKIRDDITALADYLTENKIAGEIIVSDDGSTDNTTQITRETSVSADIQLIVFTENDHQGKGNAVRKGILQSKGEVVLFMDSGNTVTLTAISKGIEIMQNDNYQMVLGSRHLPGSIISIPLAFHRRMVSVLFKMFVKLLFPSMWGFSDTQCGFKIYNGDLARQLYGESKFNGFLFDIEILKKAKKQNVSIQEMPIEWTCDRDSRLTFLPTIWEVIRDSWKLKFK